MVLSTSYLLGDRSLQFWIEGLIMVIVVSLIVKSFMPENHKYKGEGITRMKNWAIHNRDLFTGILISLIAMRALEWTADLFNEKSGYSLPHTEDDFLWFIPFSAIIAWRIHKYFHKHKI